MNASTNGATNLDSIAAFWGPRLVRFYFFVCADKPVAEASAIETLAEAFRSRRPNVNSSSLVRIAAAKAVTLRPETASGDSLARALLALPLRQRLALALVRGMGVDVEDAADAMSVNLADAKRLLADGLLELHRALAKEQDKKLEHVSET